ncbi:MULTISPECIES: hypothetical protein [unclassified Variovorax]|uniref:hypothetical protein n=1 Tax=unclassified Variovorax TaxID=663243 RepID=UPI003ECF154E
MSHYAITQVHFGGDTLEHVMLHAVDMNAPGEFELSEGVDTAASDVANLWHGGNRIWTAVANGRGGYLVGDEVRCKDGSDDLASVHIVGRAASSSLDELPHY